MSQNALGAGPFIIAALHLPDFVRNRHRGPAWFEDYALANAKVFADAGVPWIKLQDQTRTDGLAAPDTLALMASLGRLIRAEFPKLGLGIIVEAHDPCAAISIAHAAGASFVRLKVFVGGAMTAGGPRHALAPAATAHRAELRRDDIAILADVHDRTSIPLSSETQAFAAEWAVKSGADGLIVTGSSFDDTMARIGAVRAHGVERPILIGGGVTDRNVGRALQGAQGVIVSTALMRKDVGPDDLVRWDGDLCQRFMEAARAP
jgi:predicted TIM-barrel enzyme